MVPPADMVLFAAVVREGSFTRAARGLGVTKQTASARIAQLERRLGVRLLERTTRRLRPTDAGGTYYERCAAIATQIDEANAEVQRRQTEPVGLLRVSAPVLYGRRFLAPVVADFLARHGQTRVEIVLSDRRVDLIGEGLDLAIRIGALDDSTLAARKLGESHVYYVASPRFAGVPAPEAIASARCIGMRRFETWRLAGAQHKIDPVLVVNDLEIACDAAIAGVGIARLPSLVCRDAVLAGRLRVVFDGEPALLPPVYAVYPSRAYLPARVRVFVDALATLVAPMRPLELPPRRARGAARRQTRGRALP